MPPVSPATETRTIALIGNPNTGKSTLFGALSGIRQRVGNYAGVTVDKTVGQVRHAGQNWSLVDLPGTYSLAPRSPDEMVAVDVLLGRQPDVSAPDVVLCVVAADNLDRNLYLLGQVLEAGRPVVIALTMLDVARERGLHIDLEVLRRHLGGIAIVPVQAHKGIGIDALKEALTRAFTSTPSVPPSPFPEPFRAEVARLESFLSEHSHESDSALPRFLVERLLLDRGGYIESHLPLNGDQEALSQHLDESRERLAQAGCPVPAVETMSRYAWVGNIVEGTVSRKGDAAPSVGDHLDLVLTHRVWGTMILAAMMLLMFTAVFTWAKVPMQGIETAVAMLSSGVESHMGPGALRSLIVEGMLGGLGAVFVFLPQIFILFFFLAALEECGYLARAAYLMDRQMTRVGLSGKSFIPLLSSFACAIPGVMATRVIENRRDRLTTILISPLMSCSARLPIYTLMIAAFIPDRRFLGGVLGLQGLTLFSMYLIGILAAAVVAWLLKRTLLRGETPMFLMELPGYKRPSPRVIVFRMLERGWDFLRTAGTIIFAVSIVMWAALYYPRVSPDVIRPYVDQQVRLETQLRAAEQSGSKTDQAAIETGLIAVQAHLDGVQKRQSWLGRAGHLIEPLVRPLGWDWRIGSAVIASFPAREVVVASLGVIFDVGSDVKNEVGKQRLRDTLKVATWPDTGRPLFTIPVALSVMVFFALCAQCVSTLAVIGRETRSWAWSAFAFAYLTTLAYLGAFVTYQAGMWLGG